ncbi:hypothetical protein KAR91_38835 [Candidatus Pacearchaeota archaeon]|nr:hypothetical protein [Candidatus Pacearchaeota archaeon]
MKRNIIWPLMTLKVIFIVYFVISLLIVPQINEVSADVILGAHRGASLEHEENTLDAFESALENDTYNFIEFDITYTKDKEIVVLHQNNMLRLPKAGVVVINTSYEDLNKAFEFHVPTYKETMDLVATKKPLMIEIKTTGDEELDKELVEFVIKDCENRGIISEVVIMSPKEDIVEHIEKINPRIKTGRIYWVDMYAILPFESTIKSFYEDSEADYLLLHGYNLNNYENLTEFLPEDKKLIFWYFTDEVYIVDAGEDCRFWDC